MPPVGFEPTISAGERPQTYTLDCAATATADVPDLVGLTLRLLMLYIYIWSTYS